MKPLDSVTKKGGGEGQTKEGSEKKYMGIGSEGKQSSDETKSTRAIKI